MRKLSDKMHTEITAVVAAATRTGTSVKIYAEAETIRQANVSDNIALEDIVEEMITRCKDGPAYEDNPFDALAALLGTRLPIIAVH
jgi:ribosomal protein S3AE